MLSGALCDTHSLPPHLLQPKSRACTDVALSPCVRLLPQEKRSIADPRMTLLCKGSASRAGRARVARRRKLKKSYEYEVRWAGAFSHPEHDTWLTRDQCAPAARSAPGTACKQRTRLPCAVRRPQENQAVLLACDACCIVLVAWLACDQCAPASCAQLASSLPVVHSVYSMVSWASVLR